MALSDWLSTSKNRFQELPVGDAAKLSALEFWVGILRRTNSFFPRGESHWDRDFDVLIIADACRVDMLRDACRDKEWLPSAEEITSFWSLGSTSKEWMEGNFSEENIEKMNDTAYVTANLFSEQFDHREFAVYSPLTSRFEEDLQLEVVDPRRLTERAIQLWREREERNFEKLIVHYMQPHTPFRSRPDWFEGRDLAPTNWGRGFFELATGEFSQEEFQAAYQDNLDWVLDEVKLLTENCDATIRVSSDHGNGLGEFGVYGHPYGVPVPHVRRVPDLSIEGTDNSTVEPGFDDSELVSGVDESTAKEQLKHLGYR